MTCTYELLTRLENGYRYSSLSLRGYYPSVEIQATRPLAHRGSETPYD